MSTASKIEWLVSLVIGVIVLVLALVGGKWGTTYASDSQIFIVPSIDHIEPAAIPVGSAYKVIIIFGANYNQCSIWVRITGPGVDDILEPLQVLPDAISQLIEAKYFTEPRVYSLYVVNSTACTVPIAPYDPSWDEISNAVTLTVYQPVWTFLPLVQR